MVGHVKLGKLGALTIHLKFNSLEIAQCVLLALRGILVHSSFLFLILPHLFMEATNTSIRNLVTLIVIHLHTHS